MRTGRGATSLWFLATGSLWIAAVAVWPQKALAPKTELERIDFSRDILPILSDKCFKCHGPDAETRMADLRLDVPEGAFANRSGRFAIVPGKPEHSMVVNRINHPSTPMPPPDSGKSLNKAEIALITRWIKEGARYDRLWSFEPLPAKVAVPQPKSAWPRNDIDRFILDRLNKEKLAPSPEAPKLRWLRRVTLDLTGLPPTEKEIAAFQADQRPDASEKVVDGLLASPHFGERVAVDWLDAARYSDSYGYQSDLLMPSWPYRDWVVKAFNDNLPYDKFLTYQLAGDLLPSPSRDQILATAFNRLHRQSNEGGSIPLEYKTAYADDRVETFGTAMLGLTVGCARCHDHKFDPIKQKEYYQLFAYFNSIDEYGLLLSTEIVPTPSLLLPTPAQANHLKDLQQANTKAEARLKSALEGVPVRFKNWLPQAPAHPEIPGVFARYSLDSNDGGKFMNSVDGKPSGFQLDNVALVPGHSGKAIQFDGDNGVAFRDLPGHERWDCFTWSFWIEDPRATTAPTILQHRTGGTDVGFCGFDLMLEDGYLTARVMRHWPGNAIAVRTKERVPKNQWANVAWSWDGSGHASGLRIYLDGKPATTEVLADKIWKTIDAYGDLGPSGGQWAFGQRFRDLGFKDGKLDDVVFANRVLSTPEIASLYSGLPLFTQSKSTESLPLLVGGGEGGGSETSLREYYTAAIDIPVREAQAAIRKSQEDIANFENEIYEISVMQESPKPIPAYLLARGQYDAPRNDNTRVDRGVPKALPPLTGTETNNRLKLAQWVTQPNHPLTARVAVNRLWQMIFGVGLVESTENFGVQGSRPTHPELLDYLARHFVNSGWNVKALLKEMVLSATYRQDSKLTAKLKAADPDNRLYARGPSHRLSAEMVRDTALAASGLLYSKVGGPPVNPYQPAGIWQENNTMSPGFVQSKGRDLYRRSLYSTWKRTTPVPSMLMFDATSRESCMVRRPSTNTPLQALVLLNDIQFVEAARFLAQRVIQDKINDQERIGEAFRRLAGRDPDKREDQILLQALQDQRAQFANDPASANKLIREGETKPPASFDAKELAAMTVTVQTILNSDAVIWKR